MPEYRIRGGNRVTFDTLRDFRSRIPDNEPPVRLGGAVARRLRALAQKHRLSVEQVAALAVGVMESEGFPGCGRHNKKGKV